MVERWLADPGNLVPVHANDFRTAKAGEPIWHTLSQMISQGTNSGFFHLRAGKPSTSGRLRRRMVMEAVERAQVQAIVHAAGLGAGGAINIVKKPARYIGRPSAELDQELRDWLADPNNIIPIRAKAGRLDYQPEGSVIWGIVERMVCGPDSRDLFSGMSKAGLRRRGMVEEVAATGRVQKVSGSLNHTSLMLDCDGLAEVTLPDGTSRPWRTQFSLEELEHELRMVRAACYVFTAALTMMRDSEKRAELHWMQHSSRPNTSKPAGQTIISDQLAS
jgi:hypothetical protein